MPAHAWQASRRPGSGQAEDRHLRCATVRSPAPAFGRWHPAGIVAGYAESIQTAFIVAVPIAALAFVATWLIPQVELRKWPSAESIPAAEPRTDEAPEPLIRQCMQEASAAGQAPGMLQAADSPDALDSWQT
jgi:hypothetical protein